MKTSKFTRIAMIIMVILFVALSVMSCVVHHSHNNGSGKIPPGQAKKMSGSKSAKAHAPGQNKR